MASQPEPIQWQEPQAFVAGDSLVFQKNLPRYLPSDGWSIQISITEALPLAGKLVVQANSAPDATNNFHVFNVPNFCAGLDAGTYVFSEELICAAGGVSPGEKHQIYYSNNFKIGPDLADGLSTGPVITFNQQMIALYQTQLVALTQDILQETDVQRTRFLKVKAAEISELLDSCMEKRANEVNIERIRNGGPDTTNIIPVFAG